MKQMILSGILALSQMVFASGHTVETASVVAKDKKSIMIEVVNLNNVALVCDSLKLDMEIRMGGNKDFIARLSKDFMPFYAQEGVNRENYVPERFRIDSDEFVKQYIDSAKLQSSGNCWRPASFKEYCQFNQSSNESQAVLEELFDDIGRNSCDRVERKIGTSLDLNEKNIESIEPIKYLPKLRKLELKSNKISNITGLETLKNLKRLDLSENPISDFSPLGKLYELEVLNLRKNDIKDLSFVKNLKRLNVLDLRGATIWNLAALEDSEIACIRLKSARVLSKDATILERISMRNREFCNK